MNDYILKRSGRKTLAIEISRDCEVIVRAPQKMSKKKIDAFVSKYESWISKNLEIQKKKFESSHTLTDKDIADLKKRAKEYLPQRTEYYAKLMNVEYTGVKVTSAKTRYGSCSPKNSICYSFYLMLKPLYAVDYVIVHELAHTVHHDHSRKFYELIEKYMPDYKERIKELKQ